MSAIRKVVRTNFVLGIKLNSADYAETDQDVVLDHFKAIACWSEVDFIEVSGGDYEKPGSIHPDLRSSEC